MDEAETACHQDAVRSRSNPVPEISLSGSLLIRVLNTFKTMVTDEEMLEKDDLWILDKMKEFASNPEVITVAAAKQLLILIERAVSPHSFRPRHLTNSVAKGW